MRQVVGKTLNGGVPCRRRRRQRGVRNVVPHPLLVVPLVHAVVIAPHHAGVRVRSVRRVRVGVPVGEVRRLEVK